MLKYLFLFIICMIIIIYKLHFHHIDLDTFNNIFKAEMVILPINFIAFGYNNYTFYIYYTNNDLRIHKVIKKILLFWLLNIHFHINKKSYYYVLTLNDGYRERIPYYNGELIPFHPKHNEYIDKIEISNVIYNKYPILHINKYILCFAKHINDDSAICFPDIYYIMSNGYTSRLNGNTSILSTIDNNLINWNNKMNKLVYRGNIQNDSIYNFIKYNNRKPREYFFETFNNINDIDCSNNYMDKLKQLQYKYILDIDGFTNTWDATIWKLYSGSVLLKQKSIWKQWYYDELIEWIHYIPIENDFSNLIEIIDWCQKNDDKCYQITLNARKFIKEKTNFNYVIDKTIKTLNKIAIH